MSLRGRRIRAHLSPSPVWCFFFSPFRANRSDLSELKLSHSVFHRQPPWLSPLCRGDLENQPSCMPDSFRGDTNQPPSHRVRFFPKLVPHRQPQQPDQQIVRQQTDLEQRRIGPKILRQHAGRPHLPLTPLNPMFRCPTLSIVAVNIPGLPLHARNVAKIFILNRGPRKQPQLDDGLNGTAHRHEPARMRPPATAMGKRTGFPARMILERLPRLFCQQALHPLECGFDGIQGLMCVSHIQQGAIEERTVATRKQPPKAFR